MSDSNDIPNQRILVIDDTPAIHKDFRKIFMPDIEQAADLLATEARLFEAAPAVESGPVFVMDSAAQGAEGLAMVQRARAENRPYGVAFVDMRMPPGWDGVETIAQLWKVDPDLQAVICTAYSDYSLDEIQRKLGRSDRLVILKKPFDTIEILQLAHALTAKWDLLQRARIKTEELERRVAQRTNELQTANERLIVEMAGRLEAEGNFQQSQSMKATGHLADGGTDNFHYALNSLNAAAADLQKNIRRITDIVSSQPISGKVSSAADKATALLALESPAQSLNPL